MTFDERVGGHFSLRRENVIAGPLSLGGSRMPATIDFTMRRPTMRSVSKSSRRSRDAAGFSLIEFTAVLALMALIAGIVTVNVRHLMTRGKQNAARVELATIRDAIEAFHNTEGRYPTNEEGLAVLTHSTGGTASKTSDGEGVLRDMPSDPWGHAYQYNKPGKMEPYEVICFGADGREGGAGGDADLTSEDLKERRGG